MSYREKNGTPIVRRIDRPGDADATLRAAVLLAGNLARDEASELAKMLRKKGPAAEAPAASAADPELESDADFPRDPESERDLERMGRTLAWYTGHKRELRETFAWTTVGVGAAMLVGGFVVGLTQKWNEGSVWVGAGFGVGLVGPLAQPNGKLDELRTYYDQDRVSGRPARMVRDDLEAMWLRAAHRERTLRLVGGFLELVVVGAVVASEAWLRSTYSVSSTAPIDPFAVGVGTAALGISVIAFSGPGPVEAALGSYSRATGRLARSEDAPRRPLRLSPIVGAGVLGVRGSF